LILSLEEKNLCLRTLEEKNLELNTEVSLLRSALQQTQQLSSNRTRQLHQLNTQIHTLQDAVAQMETTQLAREKQLLQELEESRAGERCLKDSVHALQAEVSQLRLSLQRSDDKALALAIQCHTSELELRKTQAQRDKHRALSQELQKELEETEGGTAFPLPPTEPRRTGEQVESEARRIRTFGTVFLPDTLHCPSPSLTSRPHRLLKKTPPVAQGSSSPRAEAQPVEKG
ncbi:hypothetical protein HGM15179_021381, partial [Zosterops borbonicus]